MENTYVVEAKCMVEEGIDVKFKGLGLEHALRAERILASAFPDVVVICEQTGEIVHTICYSFGIFHASLSMGEAIDRAETAICC